MGVNRLNSVAEISQFNKNQKWESIKGSVTVKTVTDH